MRLPSPLFSTGVLLGRPFRRLAGESGQAAVEFAMVAGILLLIVVGILYFGRYMNYALDQTHLANVAARFAAVDEDPACASNIPGCTTSLAQYVKGQAIPGELQNGSTDVSSPVKVCISEPSGASATVGSPVQATVTATFKLIPFLDITSIPVSESATMMLEDTPDSSIFSCSS